MQSVQEQRIVQLILRHRKALFFAEGLRTIRTVKHFTIWANNGEYPFFWLKGTVYNDIAFILIDPFLIYPDYNPEIAVTEMDKLGITSFDSCLLLCFVNTQHVAYEGVTIDMRTPVLIDVETGNARQITLLNRKNYPKDFPLMSGVCHPVA